MLQLFSQQPIIAWSIMASLVLFMAAGAIAYRQNYLTRKRKKERQAQKEAAAAAKMLAEKVESPPAGGFALREELSQEEGEAETEPTPAANAPAEGTSIPLTPPSGSGVISAVGEPALQKIEGIGEAEDGPVVTEDDSLLADIFNSEVIVDPKFKALIERLDDIDMRDLAQQAQELVTPAGPSVSEPAG